MTSWMDLAMLVCASVGAVAFSMLLAYGILRAGFGLMRPPRRSAVTTQAKTQPEAARLS